VKTIANVNIVERLVKMNRMIAIYAGLMFFGRQCVLPRNQFVRVVSTDFSSDFGPGPACVRLVSLRVRVRALGSHA
jgi:hypothetical protein